MVRSQFLKKMCDLFPNIIASDMKNIFSVIFDEFVEALYRDENIEIRKFGQFRTKIQKSRIGRNPKTGEQIQIAASRKVQWKMSKILYKRLNKNFTENKISAKN